MSPSRDPHLSSAHHVTPKTTGCEESIIESFEPEENWGWCYVHEAFVDLPRELLVAKG